MMCIDTRVCTAFVLLLYSYSEAGPSASSTVKTKKEANGMMQDVSLRGMRAIIGVVVGGLL